MDLGLILTGYIFFFITAFPGRTTFVMMLLAARVRPSTVFWGSALAFTLQSLISVALGNLLGFLPTYVIEITAGLLFFFFAWRFLKESQSKAVEHAPAKVHTWQTIGAMIFMAEWGDVSQVAIATFSSRHAEHVSVFVSAVLAFWSIALIAVIAGKAIGRRIHPNRIYRMASYAFVAVGCYLVGHGLYILFR